MESSNMLPASLRLPVTRGQVERYARLFVNQPGYGLMIGQLGSPDASYFRAKDKNGTPLSLSYRVLANHLAGVRTVLLYGLNPETQRSKWTCVDGDYEGSIDHLMRLQRALASDGVSAVIENSRRGAHLWIFHNAPLLAKDVRRYLFQVIARCGLQLMGGNMQPGLEVYPKQDRASSKGLCSGVRGPLGVHWKSGLRYWFADAPESIDDQLAFLEALPKLAADHLRELLPKESRPVVIVPQVVPRSAFSIFDHFDVSPRNGRHEVTCPSCGHGHLAITVGGAKHGYYRCWNGCDTAAIRMALGRPKTKWGRLAA